MSSWSCLNCTCINDEKHEYCEACENPRPIPKKKPTVKVEAEESEEEDVEEEEEYEGSDEDSGGVSEDELRYNYMHSDYNIIYTSNLIPKIKWINR
jgi:hypothetical protein